MASLSGTLATMGPGMPYAIAAKFAYPERPVIAFVGDGAFQMNGMNELITIKRVLGPRWSEQPPLVFCVFNNQDLNQVTWEQRVLAGDPKFPGTQRIPDFPVRQYAELLGFRGSAARTATRSAGRGTRRSRAGRPVRARGHGRPRGAAAAAAHHARAGEEDGEGDRQATRSASAMMQKSLKGKLAELKESLPGREMATLATAGPRRGRATRGLGLRDSHRRAGVRRDARVGVDHAGRGRGAGRRRDRARLHVRADASGTFVESKLADVVQGVRPMAPATHGREWAARIRNAGRPGLGFMALSAVDIALWDLKARLLGLPLVDVLRAHDAVPVYGSGGFC